MTKSQMQEDAQALAAQIVADGIGEIVGDHADNPTFRTYVANAIGTGQYVSFWHTGRLVFITRDQIDVLLGA